MVINSYLKWRRCLWPFLCFFGAVVVICFWHDIWPDEIAVNASKLKINDHSSRAATPTILRVEKHPEVLSNREQMAATGQVELPESSGREKRYRLALDEVFSRGKEHNGFRKITGLKTAKAFLEYAANEAKKEGAWPAFVLYPEAGAHSPGNRRILTGRLLVELHEEGQETPDLTRYGLKLLDRPAYSRNHLVTESLSGSPLEALDALWKLRHEVKVAAASPLLGRQAVPLAAPNDALFGHQWHLQNRGQGKGRVGTDINVLNHWNFAESKGLGAGVRIAVVDDGLELNHPDLRDNIDNNHLNHFNWAEANNQKLVIAESSYWFNANPNPNPNILLLDAHGTAVAGIIAARGNNQIGVCGVAPSATLIGHRFLDPKVPADDATLAAVVIKGNTSVDFSKAYSGAQAGRSYITDAIDVKNNSWGFGEYAAGTADVGPLFKAAMKVGALEGRSGRGVISVWAAGNDRHNHYQGNKNGLANDMHAIAVGAFGNKGLLAGYSETGAHLCVVAPSGGGSLGMATTDLTSTSGYNPNPKVPDIEERDYNYTGGFGGTSAAAPVVSGVVALMLEARPELTWRDVKEILIRSALKVNPSSTSWTKHKVADTTGLPPLKHSNLYGGGLVQAQAAVEMAKRWTLLGPQITYSAKISPNDSINFEGNPNKGRTVEAPPIQSLGSVIPGPVKHLPSRRKATRKLQRWSFDLTKSPTMRLEHVTLKLNATHSFRGDLAIKLRSPGGVVSTLASATLFDGGANYDDFTFSSLRHWGERAQGVWTLEIIDSHRDDDGTLIEATLEVFGTQANGPVITAYRPKELFAEGTSKGLYVESVAAADSKFSWRKNRSVITGQASHTLPNIGLKLTDAANYMHRVENFWGAASASIDVSVVRTGIAPQVVNEGATTSYKVVAAGSGLSFIWHRSGVPLVDNGRVTGVRTAKLTLRDIRATDEADYSCRVFMANGDSSALYLDTMPAQLVIRRRPMVNASILNVATLVGDASPRQLTADNEVRRWLVTGLPAGMTYNPLTGVISGAPSQSGVYFITVSASNSIGTSIPTTHRWEVKPFPETVVGTYHGLLDRHVLYNGNFGGSLTITTLNSGGFSGILNRGAHRHSFSGTLSMGAGEGSVKGAVSLARRAPFGPLNLRFELSTSTNELKGTLSDPLVNPPDIAHLSGLRAARVVELPPSLLNSRWNTTYELPLALVGNSGYPQGASWASQVVSASGFATWAGRLADGTAVTASSGLSNAGRAPIHAMLYALNGSIQGWQAVTSTTGLSAGSLSWYKTADASANYASGFDLHFLTGLGGRYAVPVPNQPLYGIPIVADNARFLFSHGGLFMAFQQTFTLNAQHLIVMPSGSANPHQIQASLDPLTGVILGSGSALDIDPLQPSLNRQRAGQFSALLNPATETAVGHFLLPASNEAGSPVLSGKIIGEENTFFAP